MATRLGLKLTLAVLPAVLILAACGGPAAAPAATTAPAKPAATTAPAAPAATTAPAAPAATKPAAAPAATTGAAAPGGAGNVASGQTVFQQNCNSCHPDGNAGVGAQLRGKNLPEDRIKTQVRNGGGQMPPFPENRISAQQLTDLVAYVQSLK